MKNKIFNDIYKTFFFKKNHLQDDNNLIGNSLTNIYRKNIST